MRRYYFDVDDGETFLRDEEGVESSSLDEVHDEAVALLPEIARRVLPLDETREFFVRVRNDADRVIFKATITFEARWLNGEPDGHLGNGGRGA